MSDDGKLNPVAWRWRNSSYGIVSGWYYAEELPSIAPYDLERIDGPYPLYASPNTTSRDSAPDLHEQADELWMKLMPTMQTSSWEDGSRDVYADKVAALALIEEALTEAAHA